MIVEQGCAAGRRDDRGGEVPSADVAEVASLRAALVREQARADQLKASVRTARRIGMAVGVLMGRHALNEADAFLALEDQSARTGRRLHDAAEAVLVSDVPARGHVRSARPRLGMK